MGRFVFLSGPSCVGKGPLWSSVHRYYPALAQRAKKVVLYTSRGERPGEEDGRHYHFRSREDIQALPEDNHIVFNVRSDLHALNLNEVKAVVAEDKGLGFLEIFHTLGRKLLEHEALSGVDVRTVFLSPITRWDYDATIEKSGHDGLKIALTGYMLGKLVQRAQKQKGGGLTEPEMTKLRERAASAYDELLSAPYYNWVIPNRDAESDPHWDLDLTAEENSGTDAAKTLESFVRILRGENPNYFEQWASLK